MAQQVSSVNIVLGAGSFGKESLAGLPTLGDPAAIQKILDTFKAHGHYQLDTARVYGSGTSETLLGELDYAGQGLIVDTKIAKTLSKENVAKSISTSLQELKTNKVHIMYLHAPDRSTPLAETLAAITEEYKKGHFEKFGVSNYKAEEVEEIVKIAKENNFVLPSVYQGSYSLVARTTEAKLFPVLRKHGISFYAFSPLAGSFLTGAVTRETRPERFQPTNTIGKIYSDLFCKDSLFQALDELKTVGEKHGLPVPEIALRWLAHHSHLKREYADAIVIGGKTLSNIQNTLDWLDGPALPPVILAEVEKISQSVINEVPYS